MRVGRQVHMEVGREEAVRGREGGEPTCRQGGTGRCRQTGKAALQGGRKVAK